MSWRTSRITLPEKWWDRLRAKERIPKWWAALTTWMQSHQWTHIHHQTHRRRIADPFLSAKLYSRYLAAHALRFRLTAACWAVEPHPGGHGCHIHALWRTSFDTCAAYSRQVSRLAGAEPLYRLVMRTSDAWLGYSRLWPIDGENAQVVAYTLKYVVKGLKNLDKERPPFPWEPQRREALWGIWTFPKGGASTASTIPSTA